MIFCVIGAILIGDGCCREKGEGPVYSAYEEIYIYIYSKKIVLFNIYIYI